MQKITTCLWFDGQAEEAMNHYVSIFANSKAGTVNRMPDGKVLGVEFVIEGQEFMGLNGGPHYAFTPAISLYVDCKTQAEVDRLWKRLLEGGGKEDRCGWLRDKYGLSWQIIPEALNRLMWDKNRKKGEAVMQAMLKMNKIDIAALQAAYDAA